MKPKRIEVKDGNIVVPIYRFSDGRYCVGLTKLTGSETAFDFISYSLYQGL